MSLEWTKGRRRASARTPGGDRPALLPPVSDDSPPATDPVTGRFLKGNRAYRRRHVKERAKGIATLNPRAVPSWMTPHVAQGVKLLGELVARFPDDAALRPIIGAVCDSWTVYRALLTLGANGDGEALKEARGWLREHRGLMATLAGLARELGEDEADRSTPWLVPSDDPRAAR